MTKHIENRQTRSHIKPVYDVDEHCKKNNINKAETRKILQMLGRFASRHELEINAPPPRPKHRAS
jgi:hypothetical protein